MEIEFEKLIFLQQIDSEIRQVNLFLENTPPLIEQIDKKIEKSSQLAAAAKEKLVENQKKRRELEAEVKVVKAQVAKYKRQLNDVKTNKEYAAMLKEIKESEKKIDGLEEVIIAEMLRADEIEAEIKESNRRFAEAKEKLFQEKETIFQKKNELEEKAKQLGQDRQKLLPQIPAEQVTLYLRISSKKSGIALSPVKDDFCAMCHMRIRPQVLNELRDTRKLILCENCGRILYWPDKQPKSN
ncbi:MAG: C4-type zinc ribbon domain-containing protein [Clostridiales bacterium]|nr:C4-type zinc ribbon domain-containing protein [Clostridiales bacterium]